MNIADLSAAIVKDVSRLKAADARATVAQRLEALVAEVRAEGAEVAPAPEDPAPKPQGPDPELLAAKEAIRAAQDAKIAAEISRRHLAEAQERLTTSHREANGLAEAKAAAEAALAAATAKTSQLEQRLATLQNQEQIMARIAQLEAAVTAAQDFERFVQSFGDYRLAYRRRQAPAK